MSVITVAIDHALPADDIGDALAGVALGEGVADRVLDVLRKAGETPASPDPDQRLERLRQILLRRLRVVLAGAAALFRGWLSDIDAGTPDAAYLTIYTTAWNDLPAIVLRSLSPRLATTGEQLTAARDLDGPLLTALRHGLGRRPTEAELAPVLLHAQSSLRGALGRAWGRAEQRLQGQALAALAQPTAASWRAVGASLKLALGTDTALKLDLDGLAAFEVRYAFHTGLLRHALRSGRGDVVFLVQADACQDCKRVYLHADGSRKRFRAEVILDNLSRTGGFNRGSHATWLPLPVLHKYCRCRPVIAV